MTTAGREFVNRHYRGKYQPGTSHGWGTVVDIVGAKVRGDGAVSKATWFRVRCKHGYESVRAANELSRGVCTSSCFWVGVDRVTDGTGRRFAVDGTVEHDGVTYAKPLRAFRSRPSGSVGDVTILACLGYRVTGPGLIAQHLHYLTKCQHGAERVMTGSELSRVRAGRFTGCPRGCTQAEALCGGCGTNDPTRFNKKLKRRCMSCDRAFHRTGGYPCGKPKRATPARVDVPNEHLCEMCERWPGSKIPPAVRCDDCRRRRAKQRAEDLTEAEWRQLKLEATGPFNRNKAYGVVK